MDNAKTQKDNEKAQKDSAKTQKEIKEDAKEEIANAKAQKENENAKEEIADIADTEAAEEVKEDEIANAKAQKENENAKEEKKSKKADSESVDVKALLEAGSHFGHLAYRWNPKMERFIFAKKNGVHVIDLSKTAEELEKALSYIGMVAANGGTVLFVGTKSQAKDIVKEEATRAESPFISGKWLGGTLTNFSTISGRIKYIQKLEDKIKEDNFVTKKEKVDAEKEYEKLIENFEGIRDMKKLPQVIFIVDSSKEKNAIKEAKKLGIATVAIVDTNADPEDVDYAIPANDDAIKSIKYITGLVADAILRNK